MFAYSIAAKGLEERSDEARALKEELIRRQVGVPPDAASGVELRKKLKKAELEQKQMQAQQLPQLRLGTS